MSPLESVARAIATIRNKEREALSPLRNEEQRRVWRERGPDAGWEFYKSDARAAMTAAAEAIPEARAAILAALES